MPCRTAPTGHCPALASGTMPDKDARRGDVYRVHRSATVEQDDLREAHPMACVAEQPKDPAAWKGMARVSTGARSEDLESPQRADLPFTKDGHWTYRYIRSVKKARTGTPCSARSRSPFPSLSGLRSSTTTRTGLVPTPPPRRLAHTELDMTAYSLTEAPAGGANPEVWTHGVPDKVAAGDLVRHAVGPYLRVGDTGRCFGQGVGSHVQFSVSQSSGWWRRHEAGSCSGRGPQS